MSTLVAMNSIGSFFEALDDVLSYNNDVDIHSNICILSHHC